MNWFNKLERKFGRYAIKNLMYYIIALYALGFIIEVFWPNVFNSYLSLNAEAILHGQVWRIVTFIIQPPSTSFFWIFFSLYMYYMIGTVLENVWGSFKFNVYFFMGIILHVIAALVVYLFFDINLPMSTYYLNMALFFAFAVIAPDTQLLLFFVIPIKIKWVAYFDAAYFVVTILGGFLWGVLPRNILVGLVSLGIVSGYQLIAYINATAALISMLNFIIFFIITRTNRKTKSQKAFNRAMNGGARGTASRSSEQRDGFHTVNKITKHKCAVCGRTENDGDNLEFRFCSKCNGNYEYCSEHLYTHVHVK